VSAIDPALLLRAYASGIFPMADSADAPDVYWVEPERRGILPLDGFHLAKSLAKTLKSGVFTTSVDRAFADVIRLCGAPAPDRAETWINPQIRDAMLTLHRLGYAHSVEVWADDTLVGGLYGVRLGRAFFGESMFSRATNASKVALAHLVARMRRGGFTLLDCQFITPHLASLGAIEISQRDYLALLESAVVSPPPSAGALASGVAASGADWSAFDLWAGAEAPDAWADGGGSPWFIWQSLTQTS
jgi:leucyl/phenylalanyl-tRNA--protein transferase